MNRDSTTGGPANSAGLPTPDEKRQDPRGLMTVPNLLSAIRLAGSPLLIVLAWAEQPMWCLAWFVALVLSDWLDGKLAVRLHQETIAGAKLDSVADATFYACVLAAMLQLEWNLMIQESTWISLAVFTYASSLAVSFARFRRMPSYHTRMAKTSWLLVAAAVAAILTRWSVWPLRIAMSGVILTNLEAIAITGTLPRWRVNIPSLYHAILIRRQEAPGAAESSGNRHLH